MVKTLDDKTRERCSRFHTRAVSFVGFLSDRKMFQISFEVDDSVG